MIKPRLLVLMLGIAVFNINLAHASEHHSGHGGGAMGGGGVTAATCGKPRLSKFLPPHLATVAPGSTFSFLVFNINKPDQVEVTVKGIVVETEAEFKDTFYKISGKLPASLVNTAARVNIRVRAKSPHCEAEDGWLLKIADK
ncbi:MAG: hypothetical protein NTV43_06460 [Methylococcales bacterium]|nr:hypothetical protein [Methylococcales bacterium]